MAINRYARVRTLKRDGKRFYPASPSASMIRLAVKNGTLNVSQYVLSEGQRLDLVAANYYGDANYWWVIAAASGIGWQCQVPPGTLLLIPTSISQVQELVG